MAKVRLTGPIAAISGALGENVFADGEEGTIAYLKTHHARSEAQIATTDRLAAGPLYANMALADPVTREFYETVAQERGKPAYRLAVQDYFSVPSFQPLSLERYFGQVGNVIYIHAVDKFGLASVDVELIGCAGRNGDHRQTSWLESHR